MARRRRRGFTARSERALERRLARLSPEAQEAARGAVRASAMAIRDAARALVPVANPRRRRPRNPPAGWTSRHLKTAIRVSMRARRPFAKVGLVSKRARLAHYYQVFVAAGTAGVEAGTKGTARRVTHGRRTYTRRGGKPKRSRHGPIRFMDLAVARRGPAAVARIARGYEDALIAAWTGGR